MGSVKEEKKAQASENWWRNEKKLKRRENDAFSRVWSSVFM